MSECFLQGLHITKCVQCLHNTGKIKAAMMHSVVKTYMVMRGHYDLQVLYFIVKTTILVIKCRYHVLAGGHMPMHGI